NDDGSLHASLSSLELIGVILDDGVGEQLLAHALHLRAGTCRILLRHLDLDIFAFAHALNPTKAKGMQRTLDGLALRIEHAGFQGDGDARFHRVRPYFERTRTGPDFTRIGLSTWS